MWSGSGAVDNNGFYHEDPDAFVFNLENKYTPNNTIGAISEWSNGGIGFGWAILTVVDHQING